MIAVILSEIINIMQIANTNRGSSYISYSYLEKTANCCN